MSRLLSLAFVCVLLVGAVVMPAGVATATDGVPSTSDRSPEMMTPSRFASATFNIHVYENGSARWSFNYYTDSLNESERTQFRDYARRFESQELDMWTNFRGSARALVNTGANSTGRNMSATGFERSASLESVGNRGQVRMSFVWHEFARTEAQRVIVGDVFEGEFYIAPNQWLVFETGPELSFTADGIDPAPDEHSGTTVVESDTITWFGEQRFPDNRPRIVFTAAEQSRGASSQTATPNVSAKQAGGDGSVPIVVLGLVILVVGLVAGVVWRSGLVEAVTADTDPSGDGETQTDAAASSPADTGTRAVGTETADQAAGDEPAVTDEELLSDEDRVLQMLETNGGRMKQANIVDETGWSKSKVSMLLSDMEDDELISKLRVGRENIVSLVGHEPDAAGSPFDDED
ncbi:helix-turn-helix transcriptional regulator [Halorientalis brevis]|uniref:Helix-turn-helix transcriptional regulator n=1 Tax=Halorientalis brevis TaxID=1126241 RepID=A0ABD6CDR3_9EURY|nr:helix-turn-helix domain-containing protein [Halorientalis brevis]